MKKRNGKIKPRGIKPKGKSQAEKIAHTCSFSSGDTAPGKKHTFICKTCGYTSRVWIWPTSYRERVNNFSNSSHHCPTHGDTMIDIDCVVRLPKKGTKKYKKFIKLFMKKHLKQN